MWEHLYVSFATPVLCRCPMHFPRSLVQGWHSSAHGAWDSLRRDLLACVASSFAISVQTVSLFSYKLNADERAPIAKFLKCEANAKNQLHYVPLIIMDTGCSLARSSAVTVLRWIQQDVLYSNHEVSPCVLALLSPRCVSQRAEPPRSGGTVVKRPKP